MILLHFAQTTFIHITDIATPLGFQIKCFNPAALSPFTRTIHLAESGRASLLR